MRQLITLIALSAAALSCDQSIPPDVKLAPVADDVGPPWDKTTLYGYADPTLRFWIYPRFEKAEMFVGDRARVQENGKWGIIDRNGDYVIEPAYDHLHLNDDKTVLYAKGALWGLKDADGNVLIEPRFAGPFAVQDGVITPASVYQHGIVQWGYIDRKGEFVIPPQFAYAWPFVGDYAVACELSGNLAGRIANTGIVRVPGLPTGVINKKAQWVVTPNYHEVIVQKIGSSEQSGFGAWQSKYQYIQILDADHFALMNPPNMILNGGTISIKTP